MTPTTVLAERASVIIRFGEVMRQRDLMLWTQRSWPDTHKSHSAGVTNHGPPGNKAFPFSCSDSGISLRHTPPLNKQNTNLPNASECNRSEYELAPLAGARVPLWAHWWRLAVPQLCNSDSTVSSVNYLNHCEAKCCILRNTCKTL